MRIVESERLLDQQEIEQEAAEDDHLACVSWASYDVWTSPKMNQRKIAEETLLLEVLVNSVGYLYNTDLFVDVVLHIMRKHLLAGRKSVDFKSNSEITVEVR